MEVVSSARISVLPGLGEAPRVVAAPAPDSVRTELPAQATVQQSAASQKPANETRNAEPDPRTDVSRNVTIDASTQALVFQTINERSGEVVRQVPDQALLRIRAYARELRDAEAESAETERQVTRIA
ncbi:hypothetical protein [Enterovirga aerilata]|uniref:Flagellar protein FlaG n=1 Tax=Enterovirga aerilata TaxID=2730920 RepID=A0A849IA21_9HYPH|nr:hypothetical protein [Enterovirga sp. DB1703]NNM74704.1 hypothetical protein [Enterovirga sp. DB1703]